MHNYEKAQHFQKKVKNSAYLVHVGVYMRDVGLEVLVGPDNEGPHILLCEVRYTSVFSKRVTISFVYIRKMTLEVVLRLDWIEEKLWVETALGDLVYVRLLMRVWPQPVLMGRMGYLDTSLRYTLWGLMSNNTKWDVKKRRSSR